jgi:hypothetical protein
MSAWVKWKVVAGTLIFVVFFLAAGFAQAVSATLHTDLGHVLNLFEVSNTIWHWLFRETGGGRLPVGLAWAALAGFCAVFYLLLNRKLRAFHVERS